MFHSAISKQQFNFVAHALMHEVLYPAYGNNFGTEAKATVAIRLSHISAARSDKPRFCSTTQIWHVVVFGEVILDSIRCCRFKRDEANRNLSQ